MLLLSFNVISDIVTYFIPNETTFTKYWNPMSKTVPGISRGFVGTVNTTIYKTELIFTGVGMANCPNF